MQNEKIFRLVFLVIAFILYSALVFSGQFLVQGSFLVSYIFSIVAFIYVLSMWIMERNNSCRLAGEKVKITPKALGIIYLAAVIVLSIVSGLIPSFPMAALVVLELIVLSLVVGVTVAIFRKSEKEKEEEAQTASAVLASDGKLLQQLRTEINRIADGQQNMEAKRRLQRIAERLRIAKLIRTEEIDSIDLSMQKLIEEYREAQDVTQLINSMDACIDERKRLEQKY